MSDVPPLLVCLTLRPTSTDETQRLEDALRGLEARQPRRARVAQGSDHVVVSFSSEQDLEAFVDDLKHTHAIDASANPPQVVYRVGLRRRAEGEARIAEYTDDHGRYAHVQLELSPTTPGSGLSILNETLGAVPDMFIAAVEQGIRESLAHCARYPIDDAAVTLVGGSYHDSDSKEETFRITAARAVSHAVRNARPTRFEPLMLVEVTTPPARAHAVVADLAARAHRVQTRAEAQGLMGISAEAPLSRLLGFATVARQLTDGEVRCEMRLAGYVATNDDDLGDGGAAVREPMEPPLKGSFAGIERPEPEDGP